MHTDLTLTDLLHEIFEHEIRRRSTDRREVITRITRIFFAHGSFSLRLIATIRADALRLQTVCCLLFQRKEKHKKKLTDTCLMPLLFVHLQQIKTDTKAI